MTCRRLPPKARQGGIRPEEHLLGDVLPMPRVRQHRDAISDDQVLVAVEQPLQRRAVGPLGDQAVYLIITGLGDVALHHMRAHMR